MADLEKSVKILFNGDDTSMSKTISSMSKDMDSFGGKLKDIGEPFGDLAEKIAAIQVAVGIAVGAMVKMSSDTDTEASKMANSLGLLPDEVKKFRDIAVEVYGKGYADDLKSSFDDVIEAQKRFGDNASVDIGKVVTNAEKISKTFDIEVTDSLGATKTLMEKFGLTSDEAFDFLAAGFKKGLDNSGDFIESINEYSTQFSNGGADAGKFFSIMETGFSEGMLGTDRAADLFKEFRVRIQDDSKTTKDALESIGIDPVALDKNLKSGELSAIEVFDTIIKKLKETDDKSLVMQAGVGLMGTQFEDMGTDSVLALDTVQTKLKDLDGEMDKIKFDGLAIALNSAIRQGLSAISEDDVWDPLKKWMGEGATEISENFVSAMNAYDFTEISGKFKDLWDTIAKIFTENGFDLTTVDGMKNALDVAVESLGSLVDVTKGQVEIIGPVFTGLATMVEKFNEFNPGTKEFVGNIIALGTGLGILGGVVSVGGALLGGFATLAGIFSGPVGIVILAGAAALGLSQVSESLRDKVFPWLKETNPQFSVLNGMLKDYAEAHPNEKLPKNIADLKDETIKAVSEFNTLNSHIKDMPKEIQSKIMAIYEADGFNAAAKAIEEMPKEFKVEADTWQAMLKLYDLDEEIEKVPEKTITELFVEAGWEDIKTVEEKLGELKDKTVAVDVEVGVETEKALVDAEKFGNSVIEKFDDGSIVIDIKTESDKSSLEKTAKEIKTDLTPLKILEIQTELDVAKLDTVKSIFSDTMSVLNTQIEWGAKIDIAQIEADADQAIAAFDSIGDSVVSVTDVVGSMFSDITKLTSSSHFYELFDVMKEEMSIQEKLVDAQIKLIEAQVKKMESGEAIFTISGENMSDAAMGFMYSIMDQIKIQNYADGGSMLMGTP